MPVRRVVSRRRRRSIRRASRSRRLTRNKQRKNRRFRMRGGVQHVVKFTVFLEDMDANENDNNIHEDVVAHNTQALIDIFNESINSLLQEGNLDEAIARDYEFTHLNNNQFEMKFDKVYQGPEDQQYINEIINNFNELIFQRINDESINIDGIIYLVGAEIVN